MEILFLTVTVVVMLTIIPLIGLHIERGHLIPINYAKRVVGRHGRTVAHLPIKVNCRRCA